MGCCYALMARRALPPTLWWRLALLIAESDRTQKDLMIRLTLNLLEDDE